MEENKKKFIDRETMEQFEEMLDKALMDRVEKEWKELSENLAEVKSK